MNLEHKTQAGEVNLSSFAVPPRCPGSPFQSSDSSTEGSTDYSSVDDYSSQDDDSCTDESDYSSSSSEESSESDYSSSDDDEESSRPLTKTVIGEHSIVSSLPPQDVYTIYSAAMEEEEESEVEYMSE